MVGGAILLRRLPAMSPLASVLALHNYDNRKATHEAKQAGLAFLRRQVGQWWQPRLDDLPIGVELLLPGVLTKIEERQCEGFTSCLEEMMKIVTFQISPDDFRQT
jgi:hypothetical protein